MIASALMIKMMRMSGIAMYDSESTPELFKSCAYARFFLDAWEQDHNMQIKLLDEEKDRINKKKPLSKLEEERIIQISAQKNDLKKSYLSSNQVECIKINFNSMITLCRVLQGTAVDPANLGSQGCEDTFRGIRLLTASFGHINVNFGVAGMVDRARIWQTMSDIKSKNENAQKG